MRPIAFLTSLTFALLSLFPPSVIAAMQASSLSLLPHSTEQIVTATSTWTPPLPRNVTTTFVYDGDGGRVKQTTAAGTTTYIGELLEKAGTTTTKYVFAGSQRLCAMVRGPSSVDYHYYHPDHLGSSNIITDATGVLVEHTEHLPYGAINRHDGPKDLPHKFTGQRQDATSGLVLFPARAYDPQLGRFLQADPFVQEPSDPQTLNRYSYVRNNPINLVDPDGYGFFKWLARVVGAAIGAVIGFAVGGPEGALVGATWGFAIGDSVWAAIEGRGSVSIPSAPPTAPTLQIFPSTLPMPQSLGSFSSMNAPPYFSPVSSATQEIGLDVTEALEDDLGLSPSVADKIAPALETAAPLSIWADVILFGVGVLGTVTGPDPTEAATLPALGKGATGLARRGLIKIRHFTNKAGRDAIGKSGVLKKDITYVTTPRSVPRGMTPRRVEKLLEVDRGKGEHFIDLTVRKTDLKVPKTGPRTSGGRWQRQLRRDIPINADDFQTYGHR